MFSFKNAILPRKFEKIFTIKKNKSIVTIQGMQTPFVYLYVKQISIYSPKFFFNSLSPEIPGSSSLASFRKKLKTYVIGNY